MGWREAQQEWPLVARRGRPLDELGETQDKLGLDRELEAWHLGRKPRGHGKAQERGHHHPPCRVPTVHSFPSRQHVCPITPVASIRSDLDRPLPCQIPATCYLLL